MVLAKIKQGWQHQKDKKDKVDSFWTGEYSQKLHFSLNKLQESSQKKH